MESGRLPVLGLCGGWQFMAALFGAEISPMGPLEPGDPPPNAPVVFREGMRQEYGFHPVKIQDSHPLLEGLGETPTFWHAHYMEISQLPEGFQVFARTSYCRVQFAAHDTLPLFGTQFHPEYYEETHPAGKKLLENFFKLAGVLDD
jgi:GMP synthase-like glutamine amidotransferase